MDFKRIIYQNCNKTNNLIINFNKISLNVSWYNMFIGKIITSPRFYLKMGWLLSNYLAYNDNNKKFDKIYLA